MKTMYHPAFADVTTQVADDKVDEAVAAGWRKTPLRTEKPTPKKSTKQ